MHTVLEYRTARAADVAVCIDIRGLTRENSITAERLASLGITRDTWSASVTDGSLRGVVCISGGRVIGYCFGEPRSGEVVVLALLPEYEGKGIGRNLLSQVSDILLNQGHSRLFLGCSHDSRTRSHGFYRHLGWKSTNTFDANGDEVLEFFPPMRVDA